MNWNDEPATDRQLFQLQQFGFVPTCRLSVTEAARLIRQYSRQRSASTVSPGSQSWAAQSLAGQDVPGLPHSLSDSAKLHADRLRAAVGAAEKILKTNPEGPGARADLRSARNVRQQFWLDTCSDPKDMKSACSHTLEFYQHYGCRFFQPSWEEVQEILEALDGAMPSWDKDHPELFYETLKLNFPSLLRQKVIH